MYPEEEQIILLFSRKSKIGKKKKIYT